MNIKNFKLEVYESLDRIETSKKLSSFKFKNATELRENLSSSKMGNYCYVLRINDRSTIIMNTDDITVDTIVSSFETCIGCKH